MELELGTCTNIINSSQVSNTLLDTIQKNHKENASDCAYGNGNGTNIVHFNFFHNLVDAIIFI